MRARPGFALLLAYWLLTLAVPAAVFAFLVWTGAALLWPLLAMGAAVLTVTGAVTRYGAARWAVLIPGLLGSGCAYLGAATQAQGPTAFVYYAALALWGVAAVAALATRGGDPAA